MKVTSLRHSNLDMNFHGVSSNMLILSKTVTPSAHPQYLVTMVPDNPPTTGLIPFGQITCNIPFNIPTSLILVEIKPNYLYSTSTNLG